MEKIAAFAEIQKEITRLKLLIRDKRKGAKQIEDDIAALKERLKLN